jgi:hypothetical protein
LAILGRRLMVTRKLGRRAAVAVVALIASGITACDFWPRVETRTFRVQHLDEDYVEALLQPYVYTDRDMAPGTMSVAAGAVTIRETRDNLEKIERVLEEFDVAPPAVRLRYQLIEANGLSGPPDPSIADVVEELRGLFRFQGYRLLGETFVMVGCCEFSQPFAGLPWVVTGSWSRIARAGVVEIAGLSVIAAGASSPPAQYGGVTVAVGQTLVLGNAPSSSDGKTVILTVRAEAVEGGR